MYWNQSMTVKKSANLTHIMPRELCLWVLEKPAYFLFSFSVDGANSSNSFAIFWLREYKSCCSACKHIYQEHWNPLMGCDSPIDCRRLQKVCRSHLAFCNLDPPRFLRRYLPFILYIPCCIFLDGGQTNEQLPTASLLAHGAALILTSIGDDLSAFDWLCSSFFQILRCLIFFLLIYESTRISLINSTKRNLMLHCWMQYQA